MFHISGISEDHLAQFTKFRIGSDNIDVMRRQMYMTRLKFIRLLLRFNLFIPGHKLTYYRVSETLEELQADTTRGSLRKQPYGVSLHGFPGCGKSSVAIRIAIAYLKKKHGRANISDIVTINETDQYQSEFRSYHKVVILDDIGAEKPSSAEHNPHRKIIDFVNNINKTALNPNVDMKGRVYIEPELVILTTNLGPHLNSSLWCECPGALLRRIKMSVQVNMDRKTIQFIRKKETLQQQSYNSTTTFTLQPEEYLIDEFVEEVAQEAYIHDICQEDFITNVNSQFTPCSEPSYWKSWCDYFFPYYMEDTTLRNQSSFIKYLRSIFRRKYSQDEPQVMQISSDSALSPDVPQVQMGGTISLNSDYEDKDFHNDALRDYLKRYISQRIDISSLEEHKFFLETHPCVIIKGNKLHASAETKTIRTLDTDIRSFYNQIGVRIDSHMLLDILHDTKHEIKPESQVLMLWQHTYRKDKALLHLENQQELFDTYNHIMRRRGLKDLVPTPMIVVQYHLSLGAEYFGAEILGVEYDIDGGVPDVLLKIDDTYIVIECKNSKNNIGKKQVSKYLATFERRRLSCLGVLFTQREVKFYTLDKHVLKHEIICKVKDLVLNTIQRLRTDITIKCDNHFQG